MHTVTKHEDRFAIELDGARAGFAQFVDVDGRRIFFHTEVGEAYAGQGLAGELVRAALDATREEGLQVVPVCPYVRSYVQKHDDWADIVTKRTPEDLEAVRAVGR